MDLYEIEKQANNIKKYSELLVEQYKSVVKNLNNIYNIVSKKDLFLGKKIFVLIDRYNEMIQVISENYMTSANQILNYIDASNQNLNELVYNVEKSIKIFTDSQLGSDGTENL